MSWNAELLLQCVCVCVCVCGVCVCVVWCVCVCRSTGHAKVTSPGALSVPTLTPHQHLALMYFLYLPVSQLYGLSNDLEAATNLSHFQTDIIDRLSLRIVANC